MLGVEAPGGTNSKGSDLSRFLWHTTVYTLGNILNRAGAFLLLPVYTRHLTVGEYGTLELFSTVSAVVSGILSMGLAHATLRFFFEYEDRRSRRAVVSTNLIASTVLGLAGAILVWSCRGPILAWLFPGQRYGVGLALVLATLVLELSSQIGLAHLRAVERSVFFVIVTLAKLLVQLGASVVLLVHYHAGVEGVLLGNLLAVTLGWAVVTGHAVRECGLRFEGRKLVPVLQYSFPFLLSTLVAIVSTNIDRIYVSGLLSLEALGLYSLALRFSRLTTDLIGEPFGRAYGAYRFTIMRDPHAAVIQARVVRYLAAFLAVVGLVIVYFARAVLVLVADSKFWAAADILPPLVLAGVLQVVSYPLQTGILYARKTRHIAYIGLLSALLTTVGGFLMTRTLGLTGACLALLATAAVSTLATHAISQRYFRVRYDWASLAWIGGLAGGFYLLGVATQSLSFAGSVGARVLLLGLFVVALLASPAFERHEVRGGLAFARRRVTALRMGRVA